MLCFHRTISLCHNNKWTLPITINYSCVVLFCIKKCRAWLLPTIAVTPISTWQTYARKYCSYKLKPIVIFYQFNQMILKDVIATFNIWVNDAYKCKCKCDVPWLKRILNGKPFQNELIRHLFSFMNFVLMQDRI